MFVLSDRTAERLKRLLGDNGIADPPQSHRAQDARTVLVRCTSATAAGADGAGALCYPAVVLSPAADDATEPEELGDVWLTVWGTAGAETPTVDQVYVCKLSGELDIDDDIRCRAHAAQSGGGSTYGLNFSTYTITADNTWETVTDSTMTLSAGSYLLIAPVNGWAKVTALGFNGYATIYARLYNVTDGSANFTGDSGNAFVTQTSLVSCAAVDVDMFGSGTIIAPWTITSSKQVRLEAMRAQSGATFSQSGISVTTASATQTIGYLKLS